MFTPTDPLELQSLLRPLHLLLIFLPDVVARVYAIVDDENAVDGALHPDVPREVLNLFAVLYFLLPFLWLAGCLPPPQVRNALICHWNVRMDSPRAHRFFFFFLFCVSFGVDPVGPSIAFTV